MTRNNNVSDARTEREALGSRIRTWRQRRRFSQSELAERSGVTQSTLSNYENGKREPAVSILIHIAEVLDVSLDELAGRMPRRRS